MSEPHAIQPFSCQAGNSDAFAKMTSPRLFRAIVGCPPAQAGTRGADERQSSCPFRHQLIRTSSGLKSILGFGFRS
jgi:hypothetical protein